MITAHTTKIAAVTGPVPSPVERIVGHVMLVELACGHTVFGNPSMSYRPGDRYTCRNPEHTSATVNISVPKGGEDRG